MLSSKVQSNKQMVDLHKNMKKVDAFYLCVLCVFVRDGQACRDYRSTAETEMLLFSACESLLQVEQQC